MHMGYSEYNGSNHRTTYSISDTSSAHIRMRGVFFSSYLLSIVRNLCGVLSAVINNNDICLLYTSDAADE